jgi:hypothetical protein
MNRIDEAIADLDRAIGLRPDYVAAHWDKSLAKLLSGNFAEGLPLHEWRWKRLG